MSLYYFTLKIFFFIVGVLFFVNGLLAEDKAIVAFVNGKVYAEKEGSKRRLKKDDLIVAGETIRTKEDSRATIIYEGNEIKLMAESKLLIKSLPAKDKNATIELINGFSWYKLVNLGKGSFQVITPVSVAGVRGTEFAVMYEKDKKTAMNCVCHGKVNVTPNQGTNNIVNAGTGSVISPMSKNSKEMSFKKTIYKDMILKLESLPAFAKDIEASPILKNCLSCHIPKGWKPKEDVQPSLDYVN